MELEIVYLIIDVCRIRTYGLKDEEGCDVECGGIRWNRRRVVPSY